MAVLEVVVDCEVEVEAKFPREDEWLKEPEGALCLAEASAAENCSLAAHL